MLDIGAGCDVWLWDVLHVVIDSVHIIDVGRWVAAAVFGEVTNFPAVEARSLRAASLVILLNWGVRHIVIFCLSDVGVGVVLVLASIVWHPSVG
jgi:hypothetical protein